MKNSSNPFLNKTWWNCLYLGYLLGVIWPILTFMALGISSELSRILWPVFAILFNFLMLPLMVSYLLFRDNLFGMQLAMLLFWAVQWFLVGLFLNFMYRKTFGKSKSAKKQTKKPSKRK